MSTGRKRQLARSIVSLVIVAIISSVLSYIIAQSTPGSTDMSSVDPLSVVVQ